MKMPISWKDKKRRRGSPDRESMVSTSQKGEQGTSNVSSLGKRQRDEGSDLWMDTKTSCLLHSFLRAGIQDYSPADRDLIPTIEN